MFRTSAARALPRSLQSLNSSSVRTPFATAALRSAFRTSTKPSKSRSLALALQRPAQKSIVRYASTVSDPTGGKKVEEEYAQQKLVPLPELVSSESSVRQVGSETGGSDPSQDVDMAAGIKSDFVGDDDLTFGFWTNTLKKTIVDTFSLSSVPQQAMYMGLAGVVPYLATSLSTVALSFDIQYAAHHGTGLFFGPGVSEQLLHIIEPLQLGYGASIISFLGAIHWGLEWAGYGGYQGYPRYAIGVVATAVAWPTLLLSAEVGLITQFLAFTFLYYTDVRAARAGWAPRWYGIYRFVLTFIVGASIVASLIGRGQIADLVSAPTGPADRMRALRDQQLADLESEDVERKARKAEAGDEVEEEEIEE